MSTGSRAAGLAIRFRHVVPAVPIGVKSVTVEIGGNLRDEESGGEGSDRGLEERERMHDGRGRGGIGCETTSRTGGPNRKRVQVRVCRF
jgi:hypothetical protein